MRSQKDFLPQFFVRSGCGGGGGSSSNSSNNNNNKWYITISFPVIISCCLDSYDFLNYAVRTQFCTSGARGEQSGCESRCPGRRAFASSPSSCSPSVCLSPPSPLSVLAAALAVAGATPPSPPLSSPPKSPGCFVYYSHCTDGVDDGVLVGREGNALSLFYPLRNVSQYIRNGKCNERSALGDDPSYPRQSPHCCKSPPYMTARG